MLNEIKTQGGKVTLYTERPKSKYSYTLICTDIDVDDDVQTLTLILNSVKKRWWCLYHICLKSKRKNPQKNQQNLIFKHAPGIYCRAFLCYGKFCILDL